MGEAGANAEVIDEKLWNDDMKEEDDGKDGPEAAPEREKYERGGAVKADGQELEYRGADEPDAGAPPEGEDAEDAAEEKPQGQQQSRPETAAEEEGGAKINEMEDEVEDDHGIQMQDRDNAGDVKDDEDISGEEDGDGAEEGGGAEGGADAGEDGGAAPEPPPPGEGDALPEDMQTDGPDAEDEAADEAAGEVDAMDADDEEAPMPEEVGPEDKGGGERTGKDQEAAPPAVDETHDASAGQRGGSGVPEDDGKQPDAGMMESGHGGRQGRTATPAPQADAGDQFDEWDDGAEAEDAHMEADDNADGGGGQGGGDGGGMGGGEGGAQGAIARGGQSSRRAPPPQRTRAEPNPYRSLGDALQRWRERLSVRIPAPHRLSLCAHARARGAAPREMNISL